MCAERIVEVLDTPSSVVRAEAPITEVRTTGRLELRDVGFHYPGAEAPVLTNVSVFAEPGQITAIIGSTGSGKTTLLSLIPRLFDVTSGAVLVDGVDVRDLDPDTLCGRIGLVPQKPYLFSGTVASNLRFADPEATDEELWAALEIAQATDFVRAMPGGLQASIAQGGSNVSGGQRQRLAIARALVRKPEIYLFDDSFSALDLATDARLRAALAPHTARGHGHHRRPAGVDDHPRRPDPGARRRRIRRPRHSRRAARDMPDVPRDRRVADDRRGGGMSTRTAERRLRRRTRRRPVVRPPDARPRHRRPVPRHRHARREVEGLRRFHEAAAGADACRENPRRSRFCASRSSA